jgi:uncharacterized protein (DUF433 family)
VARRARSFRFREEVLSCLARHAPEVGLSPSALAERYVEEGLRHDSHPLILFRDGAGGRRATLLGSRIDVWQVIETVKHSESPGEAAEYLDIPVAHVEACMRYYVEFQDEVDSWTDRTQAFAAEQEETWRRTQAVFA